VAAGVHTLGGGNVQGQTPGNALGGAIGTPSNAGQPTIWDQINGLLQGWQSQQSAQPTKTFTPVDPNQQYNRTPGGQISLDQGGAGKVNPSIVPWSGPVGGGGAPTPTIRPEHNMLEEYYQKRLKNDLKMVTPRKAPAPRREPTRK